MIQYYVLAEQKAYKSSKKETGMYEAQTLGVWEAKIQILVLTSM